jgi:hypothetical protein
VFCDEISVGCIMYASREDFVNFEVDDGRLRTTTKKWFLLRPVKKPYRRQLTVPCRIGNSSRPQSSFAPLIAKLLSDNLPLQAPIRCPRDISVSTSADSTCRRFNELLEDWKGTVESIFPCSFAQSLQLPSATVGSTTSIVAREAGEGEGEA